MEYKHTTQEQRNAYKNMVDPLASSTFPHFLVNRKGYTTTEYKYLLQPDAMEETEYLLRYNTLLKHIYVELNCFNTDDTLDEVVNSMELKTTKVLHFS